MAGQVGGLKSQCAGAKAITPAVGGEELGGGVLKSFGIGKQPMLHLMLA